MHSHQRRPVFPFGTRVPNLQGQRRRYAYRSLRWRPASDPLGQHWGDRDHNTVHICRTGDHGNCDRDLHAALCCTGLVCPYLAEALLRPRTASDFRQANQAHTVVRDTRTVISRLSKMVVLTSRKRGHSTQSDDVVEQNGYNRSSISAARRNRLGGTSITFDN